MSASQSSSHGAMGDNVWQGYVSAVACLLLSLLLLMSILALAMVVLGNSRHEGPAPDPESVPAQQSGPPTAPQSAVTQASAPIGGAQWALRFSQNTVDIRPADYAALAQKLAIGQEGAASQWKWSLWTLANPQSQSAQRLAYLRLMSARELLLKQGASGNSIDIEIRPATAETKGVDETTVLVSRRRAPNSTSAGDTNGRP